MDRPSTFEHASPSKTGPQVLVLLGFVVVCFGASLPGVLFPPGSWYDQLIKPEWTPPSWLFGPVWTALYFSMAVAAFLVWRLPSSHRRTVALRYFAVQLMLNALWSPLFFGWHRPDLAFGEILLLDLALLATVVAFFRLRRVAGLLLVPYLAWCLFASVLNGTLMSLNW